jgi:LysM repeat protein
MSEISRAGGSSSIPNLQSESTDTQLATVRVGEDLSAVAKRHGVDADELQKANPQISDPNNLKAGQELHLPQNQNAQGPLHSKHHHEHHADNDETSELPAAPWGDPLNKGFIQSKLDAAGQPASLSEQGLSEQSLTQIPGAASSSASSAQTIGSATSGAGAGRLPSAVLVEQSLGGGNTGVPSAQTVASATSGAMAGKVVDGSTPPLNQKPTGEAATPQPVSWDVAVNKISP